MNYMMTWLKPQHVLFTQIIDGVDVDLINQFAYDANRAIDGSDRPLVHWILDVRDMHVYPSKLKTYMELKGRLVLSNEKLGWFILITDNNLIKFFGQAVSSVHRVRYAAFDTPEKALNLLNDRGVNLDL